MQKKPITDKKYRALKRKTDEGYNFELLRVSFWYGPGSQIKLESQKNMSQLGDGLDDQLKNRMVVTGNLIRKAPFGAIAYSSGASQVFFNPNDGRYRLYKGMFRYLRS